MEYDNTIIIDWIRHGFSCANALKTGWKKILSPFVVDPVLTDDGIEQAEKLNKYIYSEQRPDENKIKKLIDDILNKSTNDLNKAIKSNDYENALKVNKEIKNEINTLSNLSSDYDIICCSHLRRAVETAIYGFNQTDKTKPKPEIYVIPFVSERKTPVMVQFGLDIENTSMGIPELKSHIQKIINDDKDLHVTVNFSILDEFVKHGADVDKENYDDFIKMVIPKIIEIVKKQKFRMSVVSHNNFIGGIIKSIMGNKVDVPNTGLWRESINVKITKENDIKEGQIISRNKLELKECNDEICSVYSGARKPCGGIPLDRCKKYNTGRVYEDLVTEEKTKGDACELPPKIDKDKVSIPPLTETKPEVKPSEKPTDGDTKSEEQPSEKPTDGDTKSEEQPSVKQTVKNILGMLSDKKPTDKNISGPDTKSESGKTNKDNMMEKTTKIEVTIKPLKSTNQTGGEHIDEINENVYKLKYYKYKGKYLNLKN